MFRYLLSKRFASGSSLNSTNKRFVINSNVCAAAACKVPWQRPVTPASIIPGHVLLRAVPEQMEKASGGSWKDLGKDGGSVCTFLSGCVHFFFFSLRKLKADGGQSGSAKCRDPSVCCASIYHGSICLRSYSARRSEAEQGNNCVTLRVKIILDLVVQEALWNPLEMTEREQFMVLF